MLAMSARSRSYRRNVLVAMVTRALMLYWAGREVPGWVQRRQVGEETGKTRFASGLSAKVGSATSLPHQPHLPGVETQAGTAGGWEDVLCGW